MLLTATFLLLFKTYKSWTLLTHEGTCQKSYVRGRCSQWIPMGYKETHKSRNKNRPIFLLENIFTYKILYRKSRLNTKHLKKNHTNAISHAQWNPLYTYSRRRTTCGGGGDDVWLPG